MNEHYKQSGDGKLTYMPQYNYNNRKSEAPVIEVRKSKSQKSSVDFSTSAKIKYGILIIGMLILLGIVGRSETDPNFPNKLCIIWSIYDIVGCGLAIVIVNILKDVFKK